VNGIHDMGGMHGMGPIQPERNEPVFHEAWEGRAFAVSMAVDGDWPYGADRYQIELIPPKEYLRQSYYEKWVTSLVELMIKAGMVTSAEIAGGKAIGPRTKAGHVLRLPKCPLWSKRAILRIATSRLPLTFEPDSKCAHAI
jgi:nitrile hydratase